MSDWIIVGDGEVRSSSTVEGPGGAATGAKSMGAVDDDAGVPVRFLLSGVEASRGFVEKTRLLQRNRT